MPNEARSFSWRQGDVLPNDALRVLNLARVEATEPHSTESNSDVAVVITHDCDLVADRTREPHVEIIVGQTIPILNGNATHGKAARTLHLEFHRGHHTVPVELRAPAKCRLDKTALIPYVPDATWSLDADNLVILQRWLASRYRRAAFPDAFETCLQTTKLDKALVNVVKPLGTFLRAVYFDVTENEGAHSTDSPAYELGIVLVYDATHPNAEAQVENAATIIRAKFLQKLDDTKNLGAHTIEFRHCDVVSDEALSYRQSLGLKQWRLDYLSLRDDPQQDMAD